MSEIHTFKRGQVRTTYDYYETCLQVSAHALAMNGFTDVAIASDGTFLVGKDITGPMLAIVEAVGAEDFDAAVADANEGLYWDEALPLVFAAARFSVYAEVEPDTIRPDLIIACKDGERVRIRHDRGVIDERIVHELALQMVADLAAGLTVGLGFEMVPYTRRHELTAYETTCRRVAEDALAKAGFRLEGQFDDAGLTFAHDGDEVVILVVQPVPPERCESVSETIDAIKAGPATGEADKLVAFYAERYGMNAVDIRMDFVIVSVDGEQERLTHVVDALGDAVIHDDIAPAARPAEKHRHL